MESITIIGRGAQGETEPGVQNMAVELPSSSKTTRGAGRHTSKTEPRPTLSPEDELDILEAQALDLGRAVGVVPTWGKLYPGGELVLVFPGGRICEVCNKPFFGGACKRHI